MHFTNRYLVGIFALLGLSVLLTGAAQAQVPQTPAQICAAVEANEPAERRFSMPQQVLEPGVDYRAVFCTEVGPIYVDLFEEFAPLAVNSFVFLAGENYYDNTTFHRVIEGFMAQGGDPTGTGTGGPGYQFEDEFVGFLNFDRPGWLAMANAGPATNGSQFFITTAPTPHLNNRHTIFGEVLEGQEVVEQIRLRDPMTDPLPGTRIETIVIITDPAMVETTYRSPEPAVEADFQEVLDLIDADVPQPLAVSEDAGLFNTNEVAARAPESLRAQYADFLSANNHQFRAETGVINPTCDLDLAPYSSLSYKLDVFATRADASAALASGVLTELAEAEGFAIVDVDALSQPIYVRAVERCDISMTHARTHWQRGRYIATAEAVYPADHSITADVWLEQLVGTLIFEQFFSDVLRAELR
jgi:cyclophilin family peptidyl-prolyl cis-trans isomerase